MKINKNIAIVIDSSQKEIKKRKKNKILGNMN